MRRGKDGLCTRGGKKIPLGNLERRNKKKKGSGGPCILKILSRNEKKRGRGLHEGEEKKKDTQIWISCRALYRIYQ